MVDPTHGVSPVLSLFPLGPRVPRLGLWDWCGLGPLVLFPNSYGGGGAPGGRTKLNVGGGNFRRKVSEKSTLDGDVCRRGERGTKDVRFEEVSEELFPGGGGGSIRNGNDEEECWVVVGRRSTGTVGEVGSH